MQTATDLLLLGVAPFANGASSAIGMTVDGGSFKAVRLTSRMRWLMSATICLTSRSDRALCSRASSSSLRISGRRER